MSYDERRNGRWVIDAGEAGPGGGHELSMNTGVRRGELLSLRWSAIERKGKQLTIEGSTAKNQQTRHIPLNAEARVQGLLKTAPCGMALPFQPSGHERVKSIVERSSLSFPVRRLILANRTQVASAP